MSSHPCLSFRPRPKAAWRNLPRRSGVIPSVAEGSLAKKILVSKHFETSMNIARGTTQIADSSATHGPHQVHCPYAAGSGRLYSRLRFLPSGSGATVFRLFPRLAPTAASLAPIPETLSFKAFIGSLRPSRLIVNTFRMYFVRSATLRPVIHTDGFSCPGQLSTCTWQYRPF